MEKINWTVNGMTCTNCALSVTKVLERHGMGSIFVSPIDGKVSFTNEKQLELDSIIAAINGLGYQVLQKDEKASAKQSWFSSNRNRFLFTLPFTLVLMLHMLHKWLPVHWLMNSYIQLMLCTPVLITGMVFFGKSAILSLRSGVPNMNVLVVLGALLAFIYSFVGTIVLNDMNYMFYESCASIITLVFFGNYLEEATMQSTQRALKQLSASQQVMANMIAFDDKHEEQVFQVENNQLKTGDLILIRSGEQIPMDCKILWGECEVDESLITGESMPVFKSKKDQLIGGSILHSGTVKAQVTATGNETVLSGILNMVRMAQSEKPPMQKLADRISAIFVPTVILIALACFALNYWLMDVSSGEALMRSIAVLVISCPCAMGLATPAAISVGLGRAAKKGIIFRNATILEKFKSIRRIVFDKTGTLTTGKFSIQSYHTDIEAAQFKSIVFSLEKYSSHPIAQSITKEWQGAQTIHWKSVEEIKGKGVRAIASDGTIYEAGAATFHTSEQSSEHNVNVYRNGEQIGWLDLEDAIRPEAESIIAWFHAKGIATVMLTGDSEAKANAVAARLHITTVLAQQDPAMKMEQIAKMNKEMPTAMVGDGINDAPALAKASIGISVSDATQLALQQSDMVLMNQGLTHLPEAMGLGKHTFLTIKQNLFWAFAYNLIAIPIAAMGLLTPSFSALAMGFSDVMLGLISLNLFFKKVF
jgi:Cu+-exporting ATPase